MKFKIGDKVVFSDRNALTDFESDIMQDVQDGSKSGAFYDKLLAAIAASTPFIVSAVIESDRTCELTLNGKDIGYQFEEERLKAWKK